MSKLQPSSKTLLLSLTLLGACQIAHAMEIEEEKKPVKPPYHTPEISREVAAELQYGQDATAVFKKWGIATGLPEGFFPKAFVTPETHKAILKAPDLEVLKDTDITLSGSIAYLGIGEFAGSRYYLRSNEWNILWNHNKREGFAPTLTFLLGAYKPTPVEEKNQPISDNNTSY